MNNYRLIESRNTKYVVCETEAVAVGVIDGQLDLCHCDANDEDADIGEDGGMTCPAHAALNVIDLAGLNTTANDLRAKLAEANRTIEALRAESAKHRLALCRLIRSATAHNSRTSKYLSINDMAAIDTAIREATDATLRAKPEPVASGIGEPDYGDPIESPAVPPA